MEILLLLVVGAVAGVSGGMFGIGGGIIIVPALVAFLKMPQQKAQGTSLAALLLPIGLLGVLEYHKKGMVDFRAAGLVIAGFFFGTFLGAKIALQLDELTMRRVFAIFLVLVALQMWFKR